MPQSLAGEYVEHIYITGPSSPSLPEVLRFQDPSNALKQLQEILEGSYKPGSGIELDGFVCSRDYTFGSRGEADAQLDLLEAQLEDVGEGLLELPGEWPGSELEPESPRFPQVAEEEPAAAAAVRRSLVQQLQMDEPLMHVIANKHKRGYYRCTHCPQTFSNIFDYAAHMDEFAIKREFKCPFALCPWKILGLPRRPDLRRHCAIQHKHELPEELKQFLNLNDETYPALKCPHQYCDKIFHRRDAYNRHISIVHDKLGSRFNKRLFQILAECPYDKETERHIFVKNRMRSRKAHCNTKKTSSDHKQ